MFASIASRYDLTNSVLSLGIHHVWRRALVGLLPRSRDKLALDLCTGTGDLLPLLSRRFGRAIGADFCLPMLQAGRGKLTRYGAPPLLQADALALPFKECSVDVITVAFGVRNLERVVDGLREMRRVLKPGGHLLVLEFGQPKSALFGALYRWYSRALMPRIGGLLTGNRDAYTYLPSTAKNFPCGAAFEALLEEAGLAPERTRPLTGGIAWAYRAAKSS